MLSRLHMYMLPIHTVLCQTKPSTLPEESLVSHSRGTAGMRLHHKEGIFSTLPGHSSVLAKQIKQALSLPGKDTETQDCTSHQDSEPDV